MTFNELWQQLVKKKPTLANPETSVTITSANFKQLLQQTYEQGQKSANPKPSDRFSDLFKGI